MSDSAEHLEESLRRHYGDQELDGEILARLAGEIAKSDDRLAVPSDGQAPGTVPDQVGARRRRVQLAGVAVAVLLVAVTIFFSEPWNDQPSWRERAFVAAGEVAADHLKAKPVQFESSSYSELGAAMERLGFALIEPARVKSGGYRLAGARYCSVGRLMAAQIRLLLPSGQAATLYELVPDERFADIKDCRFELKGLEVTLWLEGGLFMVLARPLD